MFYPISAHPDGKGKPQIQMQNPLKQSAGSNLLSLVLNVIVTVALIAQLTPAHSADTPITDAVQTDTMHSNPASPDLPLPAGVDAQTGFRMERYRAPIPDNLPGAETVSTAQALELQQAGNVVFIDVYPPRGLGADPIDGHWVITETREHIKNSTWLPEVGRGHLESGHIDYFQRNLTLLSNANKDTALLFYCTADCWQSWNAARRAYLWGYQNIFWYPDGTDGWVEEGHPLFTAEPVNFLGE